MWRCARCGKDVTYIQSSIQHRKARGMGGTNDPSINSPANLIVLCGSGTTGCHGHHHPDAPNLGDITKIDWTQVKPVDVICGGSPCNDLSMAGARAGMFKNTRSGLWESMFHAIAVIRPRLSVRFVEWLMGLPDGHVTGVGLSREKTLRALGNGVIPLQAAEGILRALQQERQVALEEGWPEYTQPTNGRTQP